MYILLRKLRKCCCKKICPRRRSKDIVIVFPYDTAQNKILLIQEYVHYYDKFIWKFVSGGIDKNGKDILQHAQEELEEELGMETKHFYEYYTFEKIFKFRKIYCYLAENPVEIILPKKNPDHRYGNYINNRKWVSLSELQEMIDGKEIIWNESVLVALQILRENKK